MKMNGSFMESHRICSLSAKNCIICQLFQRINCRERIERIKTEPFFMESVIPADVKWLYQFEYAPLIWMCTSKNAILKVNKIYGRTLCMVYDDYNSTYEELLASQNDISIHQKHLKHLAIEVCKSLTNLNPEFMWALFKNKSVPYNLRNENICLLPPARSSQRGITQYNVEATYSRIIFLYQPKKVFLLKNSNRNWIMYKRFTVLVFHIEDFKIFVYYVSIVSISFC